MDTLQGKQGTLTTIQPGNPLPHSLSCILFSLSVLALALIVNSILQHSGWPLIDLYLGISQLLPLEDFFTAPVVNLKKKKSVGKTSRYTDNTSCLNHCSLPTCLPNTTEQQEEKGKNIRIEDTQISN